MLCFKLPACTTINSSHPSLLFQHLNKGFCCPETTSCYICGTINTERSVKAKSRRDDRKLGGGDKSLKDTGGNSQSLRAQMFIRQQLKNQNVVSEIPSCPMNAEEYKIYLCNAERTTELNKGTSQNKKPS